MIFIEQLFRTFERALARDKLESACAYVAFNKYFAAQLANESQRVVSSNFYELFFVAAEQICREQSQCYFLSESTIQNLQKSSLAWETFCAQQALPFLKERGVEQISVAQTLRLIASDTITFYEWTHDVGYLKGRAEERKRWFRESPLAPINW